MIKDSSAEIGCWKLLIMADEMLVHLSGDVVLIYAL